MIKNLILLAIAIFMVGCGGGNVAVSEEDRYLPQHLNYSNLIGVDDYNNKDISYRVLNNLFNEDNYFATNNQSPLILKRVNREFKRVFRVYDNYSTNYCDRGSFDKIKLSNNSYEFDFHHCKKSNSNTYIDGTMIVTSINSQKFKVEFKNYKESAPNLLHFIRRGSIVKTLDANSNETLKIEVKNLYAYFRDNNKREAYYNLNLIKDFYDENRVYKVDGYIYLNKYNGYIKVKTIDNLSISSPNINSATSINGEILIGDKIDIIFNDNLVSYIYNGVEEDYNLQDFI